METGQSVVEAIVQVETSPSLAGDPVDFSSAQFENTCGTSFFISYATEGASITAPLDNEGNVTVVLVGVDCAPGSSIVEASLVSAPYYTATETLQVIPPTVTAPGLTGYPNPEVETGDGSQLATPFFHTPVPDESMVFAVFYVETDPVYAEQPVEIDSTQLDDSCGTDWEWFNTTNPLPVVSGAGSSSHQEASSTLDDDGNAVFVFAGISCAAGTSTVVADVDAGTHPTYTTTFTVLPPQPTI